MWGMQAVPFDTLKMARKLEAVGFPGGQAAGAAEAMVDAMTGSELATKTDVHGVSTNVAKLETDVGVLKTDVFGLRTELASFKADVNNKFDRLEGKLEILRRDMTIRLGAMLIGSTSVMLAAMRYMTLHP